MQKNSISLFCGHAKEERMVFTSFSPITFTRSLRNLVEAKLQQIPKLQKTKLFMQGGVK